MAKILRELIRCKWDNLMLWPPPWLEGIIIDERRWLVCFDCLSFSDLPNITSCFTLGIVGKHLMRKGAPIWFHNVSTYGGEVIEYWTIFSLKIHLNQQIIGGVFLVLLENSPQLGFNEGEFRKFSYLRCKRYWILNSFFSLEINWNYKKWI